MESKQKNFWFFFLFSLCDPSILSFFHFHSPNLKGIIKQGRRKSQPFLTMTIMETKLFMLFFYHLPFTYPILCSVFHAPYSNNGETTQFIAFTFIFSLLTFPKYCLWQLSKKIGIQKGLWKLPIILYYTKLLILEKM